MRFFKPNQPWTFFLSAVTIRNPQERANPNLRLLKARPSSGIVQESLAALTSQPAWLERIGLSATDLAASNNWAVSGEHSVTGKPLLANDPHLTPSAPSIWYMISLSGPGFHCEGVTVPGAPGIFIGHNDRVAWGITNVVADVQD
jgi:acyl-homoserine lactone acylase PvdQ